MNECSTCTGEHDARTCYTTHTGFLLDDLQDPLGRKQEVREAAEAVSSVLPLHHTEELPQDSGSGDGKRSVHSRQSALDAVVQRLSVLTGETKKNNKKNPLWLKRKCFIRRPKFSSGSRRARPHQSRRQAGTSRALTLLASPFIRQPDQEFPGGQVKAFTILQPTTIKSLRGFFFLAKFYNLFFNKSHHISALAKC